MSPPSPSLLLPLVYPSCPSGPPPVSRSPCSQDTPQNPGPPYATHDKYAA